MPHYFLKLIPPRPTFAQDMTDEERAIMQQHVAYWGALMSKGKVVVYGPVMDPAGVYGMGVVEAETEQELIDFMKNEGIKIFDNGVYTHKYSINKQHC